MDTELWMGTSCHIRCEILDAKGLPATRAKPWAPPVQDAEWVNPHNKQILPPVDPVGRLHMYNEGLAKPKVTAPNPHIIPSSVPSYPVHTAAKQDLGMHYQPTVIEYARSQYRGLVNSLNMVSSVGNLIRVKMRSNMSNGFLRWKIPGKTYGEALVREAIIHSLKGKAAQTIHYLGHNASVSAMITKLNTVHGAVVSLAVLMQKFDQVDQEWDESISNYLIHVEGVLNDIKHKFPTQVPEMESDQL